MPELEIVGEAGDGEEALRVIAEVRPDVVLLDIRMPKLDGIGCSTVSPKQPDPPACLILTTFDDDELVLRGIARGRADTCSGRLARTAHRRDPYRGRRRKRDRPCCHRPCSPGNRTIWRWLRVVVGAEALTKREVEILRTMASGFSNREIAKACFVAEGTVKNHISNILTKLGCATAPARCFGHSTSG